MSFIRLTSIDASGETREAVINEDHIVMITKIHEDSSHVTMSTGFTFETRFDFSAWG